MASKNSNRSPDDDDDNEDDESITGIMQSMNAFRQLYRPGAVGNMDASPDSISVSESTISSGTTISTISPGEDDMAPPRALLVSGDEASINDMDDLGYGNQNPHEGDTRVYYEEIYVDPIRDIDIAPILRLLCGWSPCCCCLYNPNHTEGISKENSKEKGGNNDDGNEDNDESLFVNDHSTVQSAQSNRVPLLHPEIPKTNPYPVNKNALGLFFLNFFHHVGSSLWTGTVLSFYLYQVLPKNSNTGIGIVEGVKFISRILVSFLCNDTNDKDNNREDEDIIECYTRPTLLKIGGAFTIFGAIFQTGFLIYISQNYDPDADDDNVPDQSLFTSDEHHLVLQLFSILAIIWGIQSGIALNCNGPAITLFHDSIYSELRRDYITFYHILTVLSSTFGTLFSIFLFIVLRARNFDVQDLTTIMYFGMGIEIMTGATMMFQNTAWTNGEDEPSPPPLPPPPPPSSPTLQPSSPTISRASALAIRRQKRWIPRLLLFHNSLFSIGSGMILPFFPLFFRIECDLGPVGIQSIFLCLPILNEAFSQFIFSLYSKLQLTDLETVAIAKAEGVLFLYLIVLSQFWEAFSQQTFWIVVIFMLRTPCVNSCKYIEEKIFLEATAASSSRIVDSSSTDYMSPSTKQKRWSTRFEGVNIVSFAFGAVIGGILTDRFDGMYGSMFLIAAICQTCSLFVLGAMFSLVRRPSRVILPPRQDSTEENEDDLFTHHDDSLEQLLL